MSTSRKGVLHLDIARTPLCIFDLETTGLTPGGDRVVEVSVLRVDPGIEPRIVFDTIVNPRRKMAATEIHGIRDEDVENAPTFDQIAGDFLKVIADAVVASYNIHFDIRFLADELVRLGIDRLPPHVCLMHLKPMLGLGKRQPLEEACRDLGVETGGRHIAAEATRASGELFHRYREEMKRRGIRKYGDLLGLGSFDFLRSLESLPFRASDATPFGSAPHLESRYFKPRQETAIEIITLEETDDDWRAGLQRYWHALEAVLADNVVDPEEIESLSRLREELALPEERLRVLHARAFASVIQECIGDQWLDDDERERLRQLHEGLRRLGWAPGD